MGLGGVQTLVSRLPISKAGMNALEGGSAGAV